MACSRLDATLENGVNRMSETKQHKSQNLMPGAVGLLGYGGLIPFVGLAGGALILPETMAGIAEQGLLLYAAIILSFLGGLHWGRIAAGATISATNAKDAHATSWLIWSVLPSLWAWGVIWIVASQPLQAVLLAVGIFICWQVDRNALTAGLFANWMRKLRRDLSIIAILSLLTIGIF